METLTWNSAKSARENIFVISESEMLNKFTITKQAGNAMIHCARETYKTP